MSRREWIIAAVVAAIVLLCIGSLVYLAASSDPAARDRGHQWTTTVPAAVVRV